MLFLWSHQSRFAEDGDSRFTVNGRIGTAAAMLGTIFCSAKEAMKETVGEAMKETARSAP